MSAWPALADLMTVLALLSLAVAAGMLVAVTAEVMVEEPPETTEEVQEQLDEALAENAELSSQITELLQHLDSRTWGHVPCLGTDPGPPRSPIPLLRIAVEDSGFRFTGIWPSDLDETVSGIPMVREAVDHGRLDDSDFNRYAKVIYDHGHRDDTFEASCRFFIELKNESNSLNFAQAYSAVHSYFLLSNSAEVLRILGSL